MEEERKIMMVRRYLIEKVISATYTKNGGELILQMSNGVETLETKRQCVVVRNKGTMKVCPVTNKKIRNGEPYVHLKIRRACYGSYYLHPSILDKVVVEEDPTSALQREIHNFLEGCDKTRRFLDGQTLDLKRELTVLKNKQVQIGKKMSKAYALLEVL